MTTRWKGPVPERTNKKYENGSVEHEQYKARQRQHYERTKELQRRRANERIAKKRTRNQQWIVNYLHGKCCVDCGQDDIRFMTFNHLDPKEKHANIADLVSRGAKLEHIQTEVKKCEILCHNCHMLHTFKLNGGSFKETMEPMSESEFELFRADLGV